MAIRIAEYAPSLDDQVTAAEPPRTAIYGRGPGLDWRDRRWSGDPGRLSPGLPQNPYVTVSRYTALVVLVIWRPVSPRPSARSPAAGWRPLRPLTGWLSSRSAASCTCS